MAALRLARSRPSCPPAAALPAHIVRLRNVRIPIPARISRLGYTVLKMRIYSACSTRSGGAGLRFADNLAPIFGSAHQTSRGGQARRSSAGNNRSIPVSYRERHKDVDQCRIQRWGVPTKDSRPTTCGCLPRRFGSVCSPSSFAGLLGVYFGSITSIPYWSEL